MKNVWCLGPKGGTREIFLSDFVRLYQALDCAGQMVKLDLYEGILHIFQGEQPDLRSRIWLAQRSKIF